VTKVTGKSKVKRQKEKEKSKYHRFAETIIAPIIRTSSSASDMSSATRDSSKTFDAVRSLNQ